MLGIAVFIASFATMAFELAGARALAPYLGTTVEVWSGVIATVLGGLTVGYWVGGIVADRYPRRAVLAGCLFLGGASVAVATVLHDAVPRLIALATLPLSASAILAGLVLFVPAAAFLGAASPAAAKLALTDLKASAKAVGSLSAWAALGSIVGTVATASLIIPYVGTSMLLASTAILLVLASFLVERRWLWELRAVVAIVVLYMAWHGTALGFPGTVADIDTAYSRVRVIDASTASGTLRYLQTDPYGRQCGALIGADGTASTEPVFEYSRFFDVSAVLRPGTRRSLVIGGCNLSYPRHLLELFPEGEVDVLEIDPGMTAIARDWFGFVDDPRITIHHGDARRYINAADDRYELVFGDAFDAAGSLPHQLATREAVAGIARLLGEDGVYVMNTYGAVRGPRAAFTRAEIATLRSVFAHVRVYTVSNLTKESTQNIMLLASQSSLPAAPHSTALVPFLEREVPIGDIGGGLILTDDYAPVEALTAPMREQAMANIGK